MAKTKLVTSEEPHSLPTSGQDEPSVAQLLREFIERSGMAPEEVRLKARVSLALWRAAWTRDWAKVEPDPYTRQALLSLARAVGMEGEELWVRFLRERGLPPRSSGEDDRPPQNRFFLPKIFHPPRFAVSCVSVLIFLALVLVVLWATRGWWLGPRLTLIDPRERESTLRDAQEVTLVGEVARVTKLFINDHPLPLQGEMFSVPVSLHPGMNIFEIRAQDRFGREAKEVRYVVKE